LLSFKAATFDVVVSMLCLHHIEEGRDKALAEITRVPRPGGTAVISDLAGTADAARPVMQLGLQVNVGAPFRILQRSAQLGRMSDPACSSAAAAANPARNGAASEGS